MLSLGLIILLLFGYNANNDRLIQDPHYTSTQRNFWECELDSRDSGMVMIVPEIFLSYEDGIIPAGPATSFSLLSENGDTVFTYGLDEHQCFTLPAGVYLLSALKYRFSKEYSFLREVELMPNRKGYLNLIYTDFDSLHTQLKVEVLYLKSNEWKLNPILTTH